MTSPLHAPSRITAPGRPPWCWPLSWRPSYQRPQDTGPHRNGPAAGAKGAAVAQPRWAGRPSSSMPGLRQAGGYGAEPTTAACARPCSISKLRVPSTASSVLIACLRSTPMPMATASACLPICRRPGRSEVTSNYQVGLGLAEYEVDLFGRVRNLSEAALKTYLATEEATRATQISLVAEVIQAYLTRDGALRRMALVEQTLDSRMASLELVSQRRAAGPPPPWITRKRSALPNRLGPSARAPNASTPGGQRPGPVARHARCRSPAARDAPRRPDGAAGHRPRHQLGTDRTAPGHSRQRAPASRRAMPISVQLAPRSFPDQPDRFGGQLQCRVVRIVRRWRLAGLELAPTLSLPIFDGGRNRAQPRPGRRCAGHAVAAYEQTIQTAFREVADALAATDTLRREEAAHRALAESSRETLRLAEAPLPGGRGRSTALP